MAKDNIIQFPNKLQHNLKQKAQMLQSRLEELGVESQYITDDIQYLNNALKKNKEETHQIVQQFADLNGMSKEMKPIIDLVTEWGELLTPENEKIVENKLDEIGDVFVDVAKQLEEAVKQLTIDLNINPENEDK